MEQEVPGSIPGLAATISEISYLLLPCHDMTEIRLKRRKSSKQPTNQLSYIIYTNIYTPTLQMCMVLVVESNFSNFINSLLFSNSVFLYYTHITLYG